MITIPNHLVDDYALLSGVLFPELARTPHLIFDLFPAPGVYEEITESMLNRYAIAELILIQQALNKEYKQGTKENTPSWVSHFLQQNPKQLSVAMFSQTSGTKLFRAIEREMRKSPTTREAAAVLDILKSSYTPAIRVNAVGKTGYFVANKITSKLGDSYEIAKYRAIWGAFSYWAAEKVSEKYAEFLTPGVHSEEAQDVQEAYSFLARLLVWAGYSKAETARLLGVERKSVYNWLEAKQVEA